jgi:hypothetical protein
MKSVPESFFGSSDNCSIRSTRPFDVRPSCGSPQARGRSYESAQRSVCRSPSSSHGQPGMVHHTSDRAAPQVPHGDVVAHAPRLLTGQTWRSTLSMALGTLDSVPASARSEDNAWALGPTEWFGRPAQGPWAGSFTVPASPVRRSVESGVTVGRAIGTRDNKPRFGLTSCGRKVGSPRITARFESVRSCVPDMDFVGPRSIHRQR